MTVRKITNKLKLSELIDGQIVLIDKEEGWTSFDVVNKLKFFIRNKTGNKKFKVGHAGTLDPFATGLLIIATGKKTKSIQNFVEQEKTYIAEFELGKSSDTYDKTGTVTKTYTGPVPERPVIEECIASFFTGEIEQIAPMFSAKKVNGKRLYEYAREGKEIDRKKNIIAIHSYDIIDYDYHFLNVKITCSKGTYIRSLAHELGVKLNIPILCKELKRIAIGDFLVDNSLKINSFLEEIELDL